MKIHPRIAGGVFTFIILFITAAILKIFDLDLDLDFLINKYFLLFGVIASFIVYLVFEKKYKEEDDD